MQPPAATTPHGPGKVLLLAGGAAVAITALVVGCVVDSNWLSLLTALFYPLAVGCWLLFRPGCLCVPAGGGAALGSTGKGVFGGELCLRWGNFLTAFFGCSTFGLAVVLFHADEIDVAGFVTSLGSGLLVFLLAFLADWAPPPPAAASGIVLTGI